MKGLSGGVKALERFNGLNIALYKSILFFFTFVNNSAEHRPLELVFVFLIIGPK